MAYERRDFAGAAPATTLNGAINNSATSLTLASGTGYPDGADGKFVLVLERGLAGEEKILCTARSGNSVTGITRGYDGTSAASHSDGVTIEHCIGMVDVDEANYAVSQTVGKVTTAGDLIYASGANAFNRLAVGASDRVLGSTGSAPTWKQPNIDDNIDVTITSAATSQILRYNGTAWVNVAHSGELLGIKSYNPSTAVETTTTSSTFADVDATNLSVAFTVPSSGKVLVRLSASALFSGTGNYQWGLRESTTDLANPGRVTSGPDGNWSCASRAIYLTGLTPGDAKTYKWSHAASAATGGIGYGQSTGHGPAVMEVWSAP